jgi:hypothetical protein
MVGACKSGLDRKIDVGDVVLSRRAAAEEMKGRVARICKNAAEEREGKDIMTVSSRSETSNKRADAEKYDARNPNGKNNVLDPSPSQGLLNACPKKNWSCQSSTCASIRVCTK